ncbi:citrate synthase family protein [Roseibium sp. RKSG952]|uniref:citrate/2-methylcitrate synthase n=1 Tax=Roseibium sp. RKSG952 TaxID=2529384 RepID=UPI0012BB94AB|nr:citrate synthase family protein [Roseibium sp. RKSG952]MTH98848.1 helix-turn-helix domain-containing protein [Roseibium sp. RKSG952]
MSTPVYLSAKEAATELGVQPATLYAYVSRGLIRSVPGPGKQRRYDASDVRRLQERKEPGDPADPRPLSGTAVLETRLTLITDEGPLYRGQSAAELARSSTLETVATLLWGCDDDPFAAPAPQSFAIDLEGLAPLDRLMMALSAWPQQDRAAYTLSPALLQKKGAALLRYGVAAMLRQPPSNAPVHSQIAGAWGTAPDAKGVLRAALVLSADHEFNTSTFAARCAASTRAPLHAALISGLGAFMGPRHGASSDRVSAWLSEIRSREDIEPVLAARLARGDGLPGFGHRIYQDKDPRANALLQIISETASDRPFMAAVPDLIGQAEALYGSSPNIDFALSVAQRVFDLPADAGKILFCTGRIVGWIAHALEQYQAVDQIRPRATYIGERPR